MSTSPSTTPVRYSALELIEFARRLIEGCGMARRPACDVAEVLVEGDLLGHDTHGLNLLAGYAQGVRNGGMAASGDPKVISERSSVCVWDGQRLPGPHLVRRAIDWATTRAREHGTATVVIRRSHHIACLASYLELPAREGLLTQLLSSDPSVASVAPFGGTQGVFTPNPLAWGIPSSGDPIIIDISASITTNGMSGRLTKAGRMGEHKWWLDASGQAVNDPSVFMQDPPGTILPLGGLDAGHKGYGLALQVESFTAGLAGYGRADPQDEGQGATVYLQMSDPEAFSGLGAFNRQLDWLVKACQNSAPRDPNKPVRLPGQRGLALKREQIANGVALHADIMPALMPLANELGISAPSAID